MQVAVRNVYSYLILYLYGFSSWSLCRENIGNQILNYGYALSHVCFQICNERILYSRKFHLKCEFSALVLHLILKKNCSTRFVTSKQVFISWTRMADDIVDIMATCMPDYVRKLKTNFRKNADTLPGVTVTTSCAT